MNGFWDGLFSAFRTTGAGVLALLSQGHPVPPEPARKTPAGAATGEELAKLTGELAHEIKNPLSTVKVNLQLAREALNDVDLADPSRVSWDQCRHSLAGAARKITIVQKETERLEQILDSFLKYIRHPDLQWATVDLNELVSDMVDFYSPQAYSHALTVRQSFSAEPLQCRADTGALKQVLLNLFINAQQAMEGPTDKGGELMIRTLRRGGDVGQGQLDRERCAFAYLAVDGDGAAVGLHELLGRRQAEAVAAGAQRAVGLEDHRQLFRRNPPARVADLNDRPSAAPERTDHQLAPFICGPFHRLLSVDEQVQ